MLLRAEADEEPGAIPDIRPLPKEWISRQPGLPLGEAARPKFAGGDFLQAICLLRERVTDFGKYPFNIPAIRTLERLTLHPAVTFFIGPNGSGKSTLLEAIAVKLGLNAEGGNRNLSFATQETHSPLHESLRLERRGHFTDSWFLRAESFYNVASVVDDLGVTSGYGGKSLHAQSHGESFLALLTNRLRGNGLYLFDEPEAALSPQRQLSLLALLHRLVRQRSQLVIATHSPILLAYPHARIYEFGEHGIGE
ncbi:MAG TPA: AAA family ATPase, partial [Candidatus Limnocylindria bacterium]|nr:AAA family ATPase [Candidatus Limnocylindria bacterium]